MKQWQLYALIPAYMVRHPIKTGRVFRDTAVSLWHRHSTDPTVNFAVGMLLAVAAMWAIDRGAYGLAWLQVKAGYGPAITEKYEILFIAQVGDVTKVVVDPERFTTLHECRKAKARRAASELYAKLRGGRATMICYERDGDGFEEET